MSNAMLASLRTAAADRHRKRLFGDSSLKIFTTTPAAGETEAAEFAEGWRGQRIAPMTDDGSKTAMHGAWQFEIPADEDWATEQAYMNAAVALTVGDRRWRIKKVEKPVGISLVWKVRAELQ